MLSEDAFRDLSAQIAADCYPEAEKFWNANQQHLVRRLFELDPAQRDGPASGDFKFGGEALLGLQIAGHAAQLVAALIVIYTNIKNAPKDSSAVDGLGKLLQQGGTSADKIARIIELVSKTAGK